MALKKRPRRGTRAFRKRALDKRWRPGLVVLAGIVAVLALIGVVGSGYFGTTPIGTALRASFSESDEAASVERVENPAVADEAPEPVSDRAAEEAVEKAAKETAEAQNSDDEEEAAEAEAAQEEAALLAEEEATLEEELPTEEGLPIEEELPTEEGLSEEEELPDEDEFAEEDESAPVPPSDPTMYLEIPKLGISGAIVAGGEAGLELGTQLVSGAPWVPGSNTYIAGHRVGFPGTGSDRIFYNLPAMSAGDAVTLYDSLGQEYTYQVTEVFAVTPYDVWVTAPTGSDMISLQVCTETPEDWWTIGPSLMSSGPESGRLIVRAERV